MTHTNPHCPRPQRAGTSYHPEPASEASSRKTHLLTQRNHCQMVSGRRSLQDLYSESKPRSRRTAGAEKVSAATGANTLAETGSDHRIFKILPGGQPLF